MSNYQQLPFLGGWINQPSYVHKDFKKYLMVKRWWDINNGLPDVDGLPHVG